MIFIKKIKEVTLIKLGKKFINKVPFYSYCFMVDDLLIDSGPPCCANELLNYCTDKNISSILNTHHHEDHIGGNKLLQERLGIKIFASYSTVELLKNKPDIQSYRKFIWGKPSNSIIQSIKGPIETLSGYTFEMVPTPGHTNDHVCYFEKNNGWLFTGDAFLHTRIKVFRKGENFHQTLISLKNMVLLNPVHLFCSLNGRLSGASSLLKRKIEYMENLEHQVIELYRQGISKTQIRKRLLGHENHLLLFTFGHFSKYNLINSILSRQVSN